MDQSLRLFLTFSQCNNNYIFKINNINWRKHSWYAIDSNLGPMMVGAVEATELWQLLSYLLFLIVVWSHSNDVPWSLSPLVNAVKLICRKSRFSPKQERAILNAIYSLGCGSVGRVVTSDYSGLQFESSHRQNFTMNYWMDEKNEKVSFFIKSYIVYNRSN